MGSNCEYHPAASSLDMGIPAIAPRTSNFSPPQDLLTNFKSYLKRLQSSYYYKVPQSFEERSSPLKFETPALAQSSEAA